MKQKFRRLLSALLAIVMVISGLQFGGWTQEAKAATTAGKTIYFDVNGSTNFYSDGAVPVVLFKNGTDIGADVGDWAEMTYVKTDIYSAVIPEGATYVQFRRSNDTNSESKAIELMNSYNYYQIKDTGWAFNDWENDLNWLNQTEIVTPADYVTINLAYPGDNKPAVWFIKDGNFVRKYEHISSFKFDLNSADYNGFYVGWDGLAENQTAQIGLDEIRANIAGKTKVQLTIGDWNGGNNRTHEWSEAAFLGDQSLNIPTGTFQKETSSYYVSTTFYDYYSDVELNGVNRKTLDGNFDYTNNTDTIQARTFNEAVSSYFKDKLSGTFKPLYFGEFTNTDTDPSYYLYDLKYNNRSGGANGTGAHQGLVDGSLNGSNNVTMGGIELPYFNKEFLRGNNSANVAIGQVFENVQFPFIKNGQDYWEFDSSNADQTLRMKYDSSMAAYYLDRVGSTGKVDAANSSGSTNEPGFFPFNDSAESGKAKKLNYAFGVRFDIPFTMTADGQYGEEGHKQDIVYNFSGDDDVWVFIDGKLALDIGGDHGRVEGSINFAEKTVSVEGSGTKNFDNLGISVAANQQHTLTMFYMERGLWESNMKITFNFPQVNTFAVNMEVDTSGVDPLFIDALKGNLSSFDVLVQNYATRGADKSAGTKPVVESRTYNSLDVGTESTVTYQGSPEQSGIQTDTSNKSGRENVLLVKYKAQLKNTLDASGHRVIIKPEQEETFDASDVSDYLQFDMYNEGMGSTGVPYVYLKDASDKEISEWANNSIAYDGNNNTLTRNKWVTVKVDLKKLDKNNDFDFAHITDIQIGYWDSGYTFIDNITFHKKATVEQNQTKFQTPQREVPTYGSIVAGGLTNATGAIYEQQKGGVGSQFYVIGSDGTITMADGDTALFTDQFRIGSYINLKETVDSDYYTTTWNLSEGNSVYMSGEGSVINDGRTESSDFAAEDNMNLNQVTRPDNALLYRSNARTDDVITPTHIEATFINKINVGSLSVQKAVEDNLTGSYTFTITFSNIFGQIDKTVTKDIVIPAGEIYTFEGIPVGTHYVIKETGLDGKEYSVTNVVHSTGNDAGSADVANSQYIGDLSLGANNITDIITITNAPKPEEVTTVFYVESGTDTTLPLGLNELKYYDNTAKPESTEEADVYLNQDEEGFKFDVPHDGEPSKSVPNEKYTFTYSGTRTDGKSVKGTATVYTFKANNDIYVFDYGLKSDLADISHGSGLFENDVLFSQKVADTTAAFTGLKKNATDSVAVTVTNEQSTITADAAQLALTKLSDTSLGAKLTNIDAKVTFQPTAFMDKVETFYYQASVYASGKTSISSAADGVNLSASVKVMPASVVYYEDNFNASADTTTDSTVKIIYTGSVTPETEGTAVTLTQSNGQSEQYGHDAAYSSGATDSAGSATALTADGYNTTASFTFTGTGFDIIARTANATAGIVCVVKQNDQPVKVIAVDTYYANGNLYQIPVIHENNFAYGTYTVILYIVANRQKNTVYLDGIRIYNPLDTSGDSAYIDNEEGATVTRVSDLILGDGVITEYGIVDDGDEIITGQAINGAKVALLDYSKDNQKPFTPMGSSKVEDLGENNEGSISNKSILTYLNAGPTNEMYLDKDSVLAFVATGTPRESSTIQIEAKLLNPSEYDADTLELRYLDNSLEEQKIDTVTSSTAMYYKIPVEKSIKLGEDKYLVVILGNTGGIDGSQYLSFSNVKVKGYTLSNPLDDDTVVSRYIDTENLQEQNTFKAIDLFSVKKTYWSEWKYTVTVKDKDVFGQSAPAFHMYYVKSNQKKVPISVYAKFKEFTPSGEAVYSLRFKAPNATGQFPVQLYTFINGEESSEYISTIMTVK